LRKPHSIEILSVLAVLSVLMFLSAASSIIYLLLFFIASLIILVFSSDAFFDNAVPMFRSRGIGDMYAGTIFVGFASVLDEIALSASSLIFRHPEIGIGAVEGSNLITMAFFTVIVAVSYLEVAGEFTLDMLVLLVLTILSMVFAEIFVHIPWFYSIALFVPFVVYLVIKAGGSKEAGYGPQEYSNIVLIVSFFLIFLSSDTLVRSTIGIASYTGINLVDLSAYGIGMVSSFPEIIMILVSLRGGRKVVSMGIFTGSTVYKMSLIPGIIIVSEPTGFSDIFYMLLAILVMSLLVLFLGIMSRKSQGRSNIH